MFQCSAAYYEDKFGLTKDQTRKALKRLEEGGYIRREYRDVIRQGILRNCVMFVEPMPVAIMAITHPSAVIEAPLTKAVPPSPTGDPPSPTGDIYKTTTKTSTEITTTTTPNPSSFTERAAEPEAARGGGVQDENRDPASGQKLAVLEPNEEKTARGEEVQAMATKDECGDTSTENPETANDEEGPNEQRAELAYPAKLTERERDDIAQQVCLLPLAIAQQMLDVIASKMQSAQIRTNPAAVLRGIVRKYRADPAAFDPSPGFGHAEARRRRAETEARARAEVERREREAPRGVSPEARAVARESLASIKRMLGCHA